MFPSKPEDALDTLCIAESSFSIWFSMYYSPSNHFVRIELKVCSKKAYIMHIFYFQFTHIQSVTKSFRVNRCSFFSAVPFIFLFMFIMGLFFNISYVNECIILLAACLFPIFPFSYSNLSSQVQIT